MIHRMSKKIAFLFCTKNVIDKKMEEVYAYGLELLIATLVTATIILSLSVVFGIFLKTILLLIPFMIIRSNAGGYHAETHLKCILSFTFTYLLSVWILGAIPADIYGAFSTVSLIASMLTVLSFGSIPNDNRPITTSEKEEFDKKCRIQSVILSCIGFALAILKPGFGIYYASGLLMAAGSMIVEKVKLKLLKERGYKL